ncbi:MAG: hypothetical protein R3C11_20905 [Planctomycetaceae bacterium]
MSICRNRDDNKATSWRGRIVAVLRYLCLLACLEVTGAGALSAGELHESWRLRFWNEKPAGYVCTYVYPYQWDKTTGWRVVQRELLRYESQGKVVEERSEYSCIERPNGDLISCHYKYSDNHGTNHSQQVRVKDGRLAISTMDSGRKFDTHLIYQTDLKSPLYVETLPLRISRGMTFNPGDRLKWKFYEPVAKDVDSRQATLSSPRQLATPYHPSTKVAKASFRSNLPTIRTRSYQYFDQTGSIQKREVWRDQLHWEEYAVSTDGDLRAAGGAGPRSTCFSI